MIDKQGFRLNVGIVLANGQGRVFWGRRIGQVDAWQFPQGGLKSFETIEEAMFRELNEELGLSPRDVRVMGVTRQWLRYYLPHRLRRRNQKPVCVGQRQKWFLLRLVSPDEHIHFDQTVSPEFDYWRWVDYWQPVKQVIDFKRAVYQDALRELSTFL